MNQEVGENLDINVKSSSDQNNLAVVFGAVYTELPQDLYIPPHALQIFLDTFSGPLDLLLYLIKKQNIDILDIPIAKITAQYTEYINLMKHFQLELASEYLLMAAVLAEIKSRLLLPKPVFMQENNDSDPRSDLVRRLQEYERFKKAAEDLDALPRLERDIFIPMLPFPDIEKKRTMPPLALQDLLSALRIVLGRASMFKKHNIKLENLSVRERMSNVLSKLQSCNGFANFVDFFVFTEGKMGVVVTFVAILELLKQTTIELIQAEEFGEIYLRIIRGG